MRDTSLVEILDNIVKSVDKLDVPTEDKLEVLLNLRTFLDPKYYSRYLNTLSAEYLKIREEESFNENKKPNK